MSAPTPPPSSPSIAAAADPVLQFTVILPNRMGRMHHVATLLEQHDVHILAMMTIDTTDTTILRMVVDDAERTRELLAASNIAFNECVITAIEVQAQTGLRPMLSALLAAEISVYYAYAFIARPEGRPALALGLEDNDLGTRALSGAGIKLLTRRDISR